MSRYYKRSLHEILEATLSLFGREIGLNAGALGLGALGLVRIVPIVLFALLGGMLADTRDRRQLLIWTQSAAALFAAILSAITLTGHAGIPAIYLLTAAGAAAFAFDNPARQALVPNLVPLEHLTNAVSLNTLLWQIGTIVGPALAGVLVGAFNIGLVYAINALSFALSYFLCGLTGAGDTVSTVIRGTIRQIMTPDRLRGRMTSVNMIFFMGGPQPGELEAGVVAAALGAPFAIFTGGVATVLLTGWVAWRYPKLRNYTSDTAAELLVA